MLKIELLRESLEIFGAVSIEGPKWCGKTWTSLNHVNFAVYLNNVKDNFNEKKLALMNVDLILNKEYPELIDEWQEVPAIWDAVRHKCDEDKIKGKYILTGSATPVINEINHSGAGRIVRLKMRTMSLYESSDSNGTVSLSDLFSNTVKNSLADGKSLEDIIRFIIRGGWPDSINMNEKQALLLTKSYIDDVLYTDITKVDGVKRDINKMRNVIRSLARNESTIASITTIVNDVNFLGSLFEALVERDLKIYIESLGGELYHFRDNTTGLELMR